MADEIQYRATLQIRNGTLNFQSNPQAFNADQDGEPNGPSPGSITATTSGTLIDFSELTQVGMCFFMNLDDTNYVIIGVYDHIALVFHPVLELLPGEFSPVRLSRFLGTELSGGVS